MAGLSDVANRIGTLSGAEHKGLAKELIGNIQPHRLVDFVASIANELPEPERKNLAVRTVDSLASDGQKRLIAEAAAKLPRQEQIDLIKHLFTGPSDGVRDRIWLIAVTVFALVLIASFTILAVGVFIPRPAYPTTSPELILAVFTTAVGFLAGLFVSAARMSS